MSTSPKTLTLNRIKQLVDLNGDSTNFDIMFKVTSRNGEPFDIVVVDQTTLDNSSDLDYKTAVQGTMSGRIVQDKNEYQNYFLCLKADQPCEVDIEIVKNVPESLQGQPQAPDFSPPQQTPEPPSKKSHEGINWKLWIVIGLIVIGGVGLFFIYRSDKKKAPVAPAPAASPEDFGQPAGMGMGALPSPSPDSGGSPSPAPSASPGGHDLLQRLKALHVHQ